MSDTSRKSAVWGGRRAATAVQSRTGAPQKLILKGVLTMKRIVLTTAIAVLAGRPALTLSSAQASCMTLRSQRTRLSRSRKASRYSQTP